MKYMGMNVKIRRNMEWDMKRIQTEGKLRNHSELVEMTIGFCILNQGAFTTYCDNVKEAQRATKDWKDQQDDSNKS